MNTEEEWKTIPGFSNHQITKTGLVKRLWHRHKSKQNELLAYRPGGYKKMYQRVHIDYQDKYVHRLVLETFVGPCPDGYQCAHLDGNTKNNHLSNLAWVTPLENSSHKIIHGTSGAGSKNAMAKVSEEDVIKIRNLYLEKSSAELAKMFGITTANISSIVSGLTWKHNFCKVQGEFNKKIAKQRIKDARTK